MKLIEVGGELGNSDHKEIRFDMLSAASYKFNDILVPDVIGRISRFVTLPD